jgi:hypothetical protein
MSNVVSLTEKREVWKPVYEKDQLRVHLSSRGRFKIFSGNEITHFEFFDSVIFLKELSEALELTMCSMYNDNV